MTTEKFKEIFSWMKTTDLVEVGLKENGSGFSFSTTEADGEDFSAMPSPVFQCVSSPAVGIFQWAAPGMAQKIQEGSLVSLGDTLGLIETIPGKTTPVTSSFSGKVARILVESSSPVAYGQPILLIEADGK